MKVHIADDHQLVIDGFKSLLNKYDIDVVGSSKNGLELISWLKNNIADIVILDISMPLKNGMEVVKYFKDNKIEQKVIVVSGYMQLDFVRETVGNGAMGYVSKQFASADIIKALEVVSNNGTYFSTDVQEFLIKECLNFDKSNIAFATSMLEKNLSKQELKVLLLHAQSKNPSEIAEELSIAKSTIRSYTYRIREKLNLDNKEGFAKRLNYLKSIIE